MMEKEFRNITSLHEWDKNYREIDEASYTRLKQQLVLKGQFDPLLTMADGTVLGGNMRLKAMRELGFENVWVTLISFTKKENELWYAVFEGEEKPESFKTQEDAMMSWNLAHNADYGHYQLEEFGNHAGEYDPLLWDQFAVNFQEPEVMQETFNSVAQGTVGGEKSFAYQIVIPVENQLQAEELFNKMNAEGYNAKVKALAKRKK